MVSVDITLQQDSIIGNELDVSLFHENLNFHVANFVMVQQFFMVSGYEKAIELSIKDARKEMTCEIDELIFDTKKELIKAKQMLKTKWPIRYRWEIFKTIIKRPHVFVFGLIFKNKKFKNGNTDRY